MVVKMFETPTVNEAQTVLHRSLSRNDYITILRFYLMTIKCLAWFSYYFHFSEEVIIILNCRQLPNNLQQFVARLVTYIQ